jgi:hypothetical protein
MDGAAPETAKPRRKISGRENSRGGASKVGPAPAKKKRKLSAAGRKTIIEATKRRWAVVRKSQVK